jgi:hypothetical protein
MSESLLDPALVWGLIPRFVGLLYIIAFGGLVPQVLALVGSRGLGPIAMRLTHIRRDYPGWRRFLDYPTLFWIDSSDRTIRVLPWVGVACGVVCVYGGPLAPWAHGLAWLLWLSLEPAALIFPWDTMLQEVGFLTLLLPTALALPNLHGAALPSPAVAFMFRFFVLRLMLGFAKVKFVGAKREDSLYLRGFFVWAPCPSPLGWFGHHLPSWMLKGMLGFMFVAEAIAPVLGFFAGWPRVVSYVLLTALMIGIQATGNWGFFNIGYALLIVCLLDTKSSIFDLAQEPWASQAWQWPEVAVNALLLVMFVTGLIYLVVFDSWTTRTMIRWPWDRFAWNRWWLRALLAYLRAISPLRIINGYGVFPPGAGAPLRGAVLFEGSDDGVTWKAYSFRHMPTRASERSQFIAPYQPRLDMAMSYAGGCMYDASFWGSYIGDGTAHDTYARSSWLDRMCQRILEGEPEILRLLGDNPFPDAPPTWMRVSIALMTPTRPEVRRATGDWWHMRRHGVFVPARRKEAWVEAIALAEAEVFHPDWVDYKRRAAPLQAVARAYASGVEPNTAILADSDLSAEDVRRFWAEFVPCVNQDRGDFSRYLERGRALYAQFDRFEVARFERVLERFAWLLRLRTERHQFGAVEPRLPIDSNFRYHMFLHEMVMDGREAYEAVLREPVLAVERLQRSTDALQVWTVALARHELMLQHICAFRWSAIGKDGYRLKIPGLFEYYPLLEQVVPPGEEFRADITKLENGEFCVETFYPPPGLALPQA